MKSKRLTTCLEYTKGYDKLLDVGTDHGQIPIEAIQKNYVKKAIASDNKKGPLTSCEKNVHCARLQHDIDIVLADGLQSLDESVDVCLIAGMGGCLIARILEDDFLLLKRIIVQANNEMAAVRKIMNNKLWTIVDERIVFEQNKYYEIVVFEKGTEQLSDDAILFGPINLLKKTTNFINMCKKEQQALLKIIDKINDKEEQNKKLLRIKKLGDVIDASTSNY